MIGLLLSLLLSIIPSYANSSQAYFYDKELNVNFEVFLNDPILWNTSMMNENGTEIIGNQIIHTLILPNEKKYRCKMPQESNVAMKSEVQLTLQAKELLKSMKHRKCLTATSGWWTYKFCIGRSIEQYHAVNGLPGKDVYVLGRYDKSRNLGSNDIQSFDAWKSSDAKSNKTHSFHYEYYTNGTICEKTGQETQSYIRFTCENEEMPDKIIEVLEYEACKYIITVAINKLCIIPEFRGIKQQIINCSPLLDKYEYDKWVNVQTNNEKFKVDSITKNANLDMPLIGRNLNSNEDHADSDHNFMEDVLNESNLKKLDEEYKAVIEKESKTKLDENRKTSKPSSLDEIWTKIQTEKERYKNDAVKKEPEKYYFEFKLLVPESVLYDEMSDEELNQIFQKLKTLNWHKIQEKTKNND